MLGVPFDPGWANRVGLAPWSRGPEGPTGSVWPGLIHFHGQCWEPAMPPCGDSQSARHTLRPRQQTLARPGERRE